MARKNLLAMAAAAILTLFMVLVIWTNYTSQVKLQKATVDQFKEHVSIKAVYISHFFAGRKNDLVDLANSGEILSYFENKAMGMSKEYGLWASLVGISEQFRRVVDKKAWEGIRIYKRIAFVGASGQILADNTGVEPDPQTWSWLKTHPGVHPDREGIYSVATDGGTDLVQTLPCHFGGQAVGAVAAWLNTRMVTATLLKGDLTSTYHRDLEFLAFEGTILPSQPMAPRLLREQVKDDLPPPSGEIQVHRYAVGASKPASYVVASSPIRETPFLLLVLVPEEDVLGALAPWQLLVFTCVLAVLFMGGTAHILRMSAKNLVLNVQVSESAKHARSMERQNRRLEAEVQARKVAEEALQSINEELEQRVNARTEELKRRSNALAREVSERREAETALRTVFNNTHDAIFIQDEDGRILDVNERMLRMFDVAREKILSLSASEFFIGHNKQFELFEDKRKRAIEGEPVVCDWVAWRPGDGSLFDVEIALNRIEMEGRLVLLTNVHDISEQKMALEQQEEHQKFLSTIFEGIGASIFVFDPTEGVMVDCNSVGEELLSLSREEILETSRRMDYQILSDEKKYLLFPDIHDQGLYEEGVLSFPNGSSIPISRRLFELFIGGRSHLVEVVFDITERKNLERKLNMAQKLESIGLLASGIAHEINTPIQYVGDSIRFVQEVLADMEGLFRLYDKAVGDVENAFVEDIEEHKEEMDLDFALEEAPKACERAMEGVHRVATIVLAMKNFSHPGGEKLKPTDINKAIENTVTVARNEWKYVADMETSLDPELPLVYCLPGGVNQILLNMIVNAAHAIGECKLGGDKGKIHISTKLDGEFVEIRIKDTGCGISKENLEVIFDPFFTTKDVGKGTGQGLAIAHDIVVEKHGGSIEVESEVGKGSTFIIRLPVGRLEV